MSIPDVIMTFARMSDHHLLIALVLTLALTGIYLLGLRALHRFSKL